MTTTAIRPRLGSLVQAILTTAPIVAREAGLSRNWCLTAAGLVQSILAKHGYDGVRVLGVDFAAFNKPAWGLYTRRVPPVHWPDNAWSVGTAGSGRVDATGWDGHAVAYVPARITGSAPLIVDLSADQFSRRGRGLSVPPLAVPVSSTFLGGDLNSFDLGQVSVTMIHNPRLRQFVTSEVAAATEFLEYLTEAVLQRIEPTDDAAQTWQLTTLTTMSRPPGQFLSVD